MDNIKKSLCDTFPDCIIVIKKNVKSEQKNIFNFCKDVQDEDTHYSIYSNPIFSFEFVDNKLIFKTKYLSPCMFLINTFYKSYVLIDNYYYIEMNNLSLNNNLYESDELIFDPKNIIPIEYITMMIDFIDYDKNNFIKCIKVEFVKSESTKNLDYKNFLLNIDNFNINNNILKKSYVDYEQNCSNIKLKILDPNWIVLDSNKKFKSNCKNYSDIVDKFFAWVNKSNFTLLQLQNQNNKNNNLIGTIHKYEGGIDLSGLFLSLSYSKIIEKNNCDYHCNYMKSYCNCYYCINRFNYNISDTFHKNIYSGSNSDLLCVVIFNELLKKIGLVTVLVIDNQIYTNKSDGLLSEFYYWFYGFYNKKIEL